MTFDEYQNAASAGLDPAETVALGRMAIPAMMNAQKAKRRRGALMSVLAGGGGGGEEDQKSIVSPDDNPNTGPAVPPLELGDEADTENLRIGPAPGVKSNPFAMRMNNYLRDGYKLTAPDGLSVDRLREFQPQEDDLESPNEFIREPDDRFPSPDFEIGSGRPNMLVSALRGGHSETSGNEREPDHDPDDSKPTPSDPWADLTKRAAAVTWRGKHPPSVSDAELLKHLQQRAQAGDPDALEAAQGYVDRLEGFPKLKGGNALMSALGAHENAGGHALPDVPAGRFEAPDEYAGLENLAPVGEGDVPTGPLFGADFKYEPSRPRGPRTDAGPGNPLLKALQAPAPADEAESADLRIGASPNKQLHDFYPTVADLEAKKAAAGVGSPSGGQGARAMPDQSQVNIHSRGQGGALVNALSGAPVRDAAGHYPWAYQNTGERDAILQGAAEGKSENQVRRELSQANRQNVQAPGDEAEAMAAAGWLENNPGGDLNEFYSKVLPRQRAERGAVPLSLNKAAGPDALENLQAKAATGDHDANVKLAYLATPEGQQFGTMKYGKTALMRALGGDAAAQDAAKNSAADRQDINNAVNEAQRMVEDGLPESEAQARALARVNTLRRHSGLAPLNPDDVNVYPRTGQPKTAARDAKDVQAAIDAAQKLVDGGTAPDQARQNAAARVNAVRRAEGLAPITVDAEALSTKPGAPTGPARDKADRGKFFDYVKAGYSADDANKLVNAERQDDGLPASDYTRYAASTSKEKEAVAVKDKADMDEALKQYNEAIRAGIPPDEAKKSATEAVNAGRRLSNKKDLDPNAIPFPEARVNEGLDATREKAKAEATRRIAEAAKSGEDVTAKTLTDFNSDLKRIGAKPLTAEEVKPAATTYTSTEKGLNAELAAAGIADPDKEFQTALGRVANKIGHGQIGGGPGIVGTLNRLYSIGPIGWAKGKMAETYFKDIAPEDVGAMQTYLVQDIQERNPELSPAAVKRFVAAKIKRMQ
ncbi:MAG: hypothetical protein HY291_02210 [Planctomycetes bacterium]|nr:hypothetical protein [Planctomycetota bacterium]